MAPRNPDQEVFIFGVMASLCWIKQWKLYKHGGVELWCIVAPPCPVLTFWCVVTPSRSGVPTLFWCVVPHCPGLVSTYVPPAWFAWQEGRNTCNTHCTLYSALRRAKRSTPWNTLFGVLHCWCNRVDGRRTDTSDYDISPKIRGVWTHLWATVWTCCWYQRYLSSQPAECWAGTCVPQ